MKARKKNKAAKSPEVFKRLNRTAAIIFFGLGLGIIAKFAPEHLLQGAAWAIFGAAVGSSGVLIALTWKIDDEEED